MKRPEVSPELYKRLTAVALVSLVIIAITGGAVRISGSGLGCTEWPTCADNHVIAPLDWHPMIEFGNRIFTGVVSFLAISAVLASFFLRPRRRDLILISLALAAGVLAEAVIGGLSVIYKLSPAWVMAHFIASMVLIAIGLVLFHRSREPDSPAQPATHPQHIMLARAVMALAAVVLFVGTLVTGTGPHGGDANVHRLGFDPHTITKVHGVLVWLLVMTTAFSVWRLQAAAATSTLIRRGEILIGVMLAQAAIGYLQYSLHVPAALVLIHIAGATSVWLAVVWYNLGFYERFGKLDMPVYDGDQYPKADFMMRS